MGRLAGRFRIVFLISLFFFSCSHTPEELVVKHTRRGDAYSEKGKLKEAVLEYMNAVKAAPDNAALRWKLAKTALEAKDLRTAYAELQKTVELDSANFEAKKILGEIYVVMGETDRASQIADNLVNARPNDPQGYILKSALASRLGKVDEAIAHLRKAVDLDPQNAGPILIVGNLYLLTHDPITARAWFDRALAVDPNSVEVRVTRGNFFFASGNKDEGEKEYRRAIELSNEKEDLRIRLAQHYLVQGRVEESEKELNGVIQEMNSLKARKVLAEIKLDTGRTDEAKSEVKAILLENEKDPDGTYLKGRIALAENRLDDAKALFGEAIKQVPSMSRARLFLGITETTLGRADAAKKELEAAVRLDPGNVRARLLLGDLHLKNNDPVAAETEALEVLRRNPANFQAAVLYGDAFLLRKEWRKAEQVFGMIIRQTPKTPVGYFKMGISRKMQRKPAEAATYFSQAMERNPGDIATTSEYLIALASSGQVDKARGVLGEYLAKGPKNPRIWEMAGRFHLASRKPGEAESAFLKAIELDPKSPQSLYDLGVLYASQKKYPEAEEKLKAAVEKDDRNVSARTMLGVVLQSQGKVEDANRHYRRVLEIDPKNALAANNLASNLADRGGNLDEAIRLAQIAQAAAPDNPAIRDTLGWLYYKKGLFESAFPLLSDAARKLDKNAVVRYHHGMALAKTGKKREAVQELNAALSLDPNFPESGEARKVLANLKAIELDPKSPQSLYDLGVLYASQKKYPEAEEKLKAAVEKDDRNVSARTMLGVVLQSQGKVEDANRHYRRVLEIDPKNALAANNLASNLADRGGNLDEAIRLAQIAQVATPENPAIWDTLGWLYYKKGLFESAFPLLSDAARKLDKNAVVRYHHGMALAKTGKKREAVQELNAALSLDPNFPESGEARKVLESLR